MFIETYPTDIPRSSGAKCICFAPNGAKKISKSIRGYKHLAPLGESNLDEQEQ